MEEPETVTQEIDNNDDSDGEKEGETKSPEAKRPKLDQLGLPVKGQENEGPSAPKKAHKLAWTTNNDSHDPFIFLGPESDIIQEAQKLYGLKDGFPMDQFVIRTESDKIRTIYFVSKDVKQILLAENSRKLKVVNTGIKVFSRHSIGAKSGGFQFRINSEGVMTLAPHLSSDTVIPTSYSDLLVFLTNEYPKIESFSTDMQEKLTNAGMRSS